MVRASALQGMAITVPLGVPFFCLLALGQIGGDANKGRLLAVLRRGQKSLERPWAALALGLFNHHRLEKHSNATLDTLVSDAMTKQLGEIKDPPALAAVAVALGLSRQTETSARLLDLLNKHRSKEELAGYLCIGLALMKEQKARTPIHQIVKESVRRPKLLQQAAIALGKLGDKSVTRTLIDMLQEPESNLAKLSAIAAALSFIGDRRTITPLRDMLFNDELTPLSRAFAAVALGGVADKEKLPWNSKISRNMNYRAAVETLTQSGTGVLDIAAAHRTSRGGGIRVAIIDSDADRSHEDLKGRIHRVQDFAYRIDIQWWTFVIAGLGAIGIAFLTVSLQSIKAALENPVNSLKME